MLNLALFLGFIEAQRRPRQVPRSCGSSKARRACGLARFFLGWQRLLTVGT